MGSNNGDGSCSASGGGGGDGGGGGWSGSVTTTSRPAPAATTPAWSGASVVDCSVQDGLFPDPNNCRGFIKCAQVLVNMSCHYLLTHGVRVTRIPRSAEEAFTLTRSPTTVTGPQPPTAMADPCEIIKGKETIVELNTKYQISLLLKIFVLHISNDNEVKSNNMIIATPTQIHSLIERGQFFASLMIWMRKLLSDLSTESSLNINIFALFLLKT